jgi:tRNA A-37 threonylcarbamoyl transferase component Bud32
MVEKKADTFETRKIPPWTFYLKSTLADALMASELSNPETLKKNGKPASVGGRTKAAVFEFKGGKGVLRELRHGGMFRAITGGAFLSKKRPLSEIEILEYAHNRGINVPEPLGAAFRRSGVGFKAFIATRLIESAVELAECFNPHAKITVKERHLIIFTAGREVRKMHDLGILHADLHVRNILIVRGKNSIAFIIDFDKAVVKKQISISDRGKNLLRLGRSIDKLPADAQPTNSDMARFMKAYLSSGSSIDIDLKFYARKLAATRKLHRISRKLPGQKERI